MSELIVALDMQNLDDVKSIVKDFDKKVDFYKVGMELFYSEGRRAIEYLKNENKKVFLDLKLHDIPNTVSKGLISLANLNVDILNVHASGGFSMMKFANESLKEFCYKKNLIIPKLIAVTILTSIGDEDYEKIGYKTDVKNQVLNLAKLTKKAGLDGVVASVLETNLIKQNLGENFLIITPGIRPNFANIDDQNRIASPSEAIKNGSTHLVVGRALTLANDKLRALEEILKEMEI